MKNKHAKVMVLVHYTLSECAKNKCMKFRGNTSNGYQVIEQTQFCDRQMDARGKTIMSPDIIKNWIGLWSENLAFP